MSAVSGEWLLTECGYANGGSVIAARSLMSSLGLLCLALGLVNVLDPSRTWAFSWAEARAQLCEKTNWFGTVFAIIYAAFYARFASQWTYLAGVYNQIKAAESTKQCDPLKLAEWKPRGVEAGFHRGRGDAAPRRQGVVRGSNRSVEALARSARSGRANRE